MDIFPVYATGGFFRLILDVHLKNCHTSFLYVKQMSTNDTCGGIHESICIHLNTFISFIHCSVKRDYRSFVRSNQTLFPYLGSTSDGILATYLIGGETMGPLAGVKVLDLSKYGLSRYTSMIMGDLGAEVTVVEMQKNAGQILDAVSDDVGSLYIGTIAIRSALPLNGLSIAQLQVKDYRIDFLNKFPYNILKYPSSCESQLAGSRKILSE